MNTITEKMPKAFIRYMAYLNDVEEGGETEFLYQSIRVKPKQGTMVCPSSFTHTHRSNPPLKGDKYMINGWVEYDKWPMQNIHTGIFRNN